MSVPVPAVCDSCGDVFRSPISIGTNNVTLRNIIAGSCPSCGMGTLVVPDATYSAISSTMLALTAGDVSSEELRRLLVILQSAKQQKVNPSEVANDIRSKVPELRSLADILPKTRSDCYAFLTLLVLVINTLQGWVQKSQVPSEPITEQDVQRLIQESLENHVDGDKPSSVKQKEHTRSRESHNTTSKRENPGHK